MANAATTRATRPRTLSPSARARDEGLGFRGRQNIFRTTKLFILPLVPTRRV